MCQTRAQIWGLSLKAPPAQPCTGCFGSKINQNHSPVCYLSVLPQCYPQMWPVGRGPTPVMERCLVMCHSYIILMLPLQAERAWKWSTLVVKLYVQAHPGRAAVCFNASVASQSLWMSWRPLTLAGLFWADERLLFLSLCVCAIPLLLAAPGVCLRFATLDLALALHTVPHAVAKVDQETWEKCWERCEVENKGY